MLNPVSVLSKILNLSQSDFMQQDLQKQSQCGNKAVTYTLVPRLQPPCSQ